MKKSRIMTIEEILAYPPGRDGAILILSPSDVGTYLVDLPPLKPEQAEGAIRFKLRAMYPGAPQETVIDFVRNGPKRGAYLVFATQRAGLHRYQDLRTPLVSGAHLMRSVPRSTEGGPHLVVLIAPRWIEAAVLEEKRILSFASSPRGERLEYDMEELLVSLSRPSGMSRSSMISVSGLGTDAAGAAVEALTRVTGLRPTRYEADELVSGSRVADRFLFASPPKNRGTRAAILAALVALNMIAGALALSRYADAWEKRVSALRSEYRLLSMETAKSGALKKKLAELQSAVASLPPRPVVSGYELLEEIAYRMGGRAWARSLAVRSDSFQLEADGEDALDILRRFEASTVFKEIRLHQATPLPAGGERFTLSGKVRYDEE